MGIFSRFKDIVSANINSMLDKAEDPEKLIRLMIREMEETLIEMKAACAGAMADHQKANRDLEELGRRVEVWDGRARLAVERGRDDLAREAIAERKRLAHQVEVLTEEAKQGEHLVAQAQDDIAQLESKLATAKDKQRCLLTRARRAVERKQARGEMRRVEANETILRFDRLERQIERLEAEAGLEGPPQGGPGLDAEFRALEGRDDIEQELAALKKSLKGE